MTGARAAARRRTTASKGLGAMLAGKPLNGLARMEGGNVFAGAPGHSSVSARIEALGRRRTPPALSFRIA
jgi:hypothetical protein